ncbi:hypothetical protein BT63DRAFT_457779 [Microthyrium microscopicum]|uniref:Uncharacterized protein n=1 Tax=Microthyrium microscopicum TaxID=703497 RepID=A0A6A6U6A9_9PEZI|nr:hypothetical protein BT63DRAFT_457779 [Microthyrium microscopicum]
MKKKANKKEMRQDGTAEFCASARHKAGSPAWAAMLHRQRPRKTGQEDESISLRVLQAAAGRRCWPMARRPSNQDEGLACGEEGQQHRGTGGQTGQQNRLSGQDASWGCSSGQGMESRPSRARLLKRCESCERRQENGPAILEPADKIGKRRRKMKEHVSHVQSLQGWLVDIDNKAHRPLNHAHHDAKRNPPDPGSIVATGPGIGKGRMKGNSMRLRRCKSQSSV